MWGVCLLAMLHPTLRHIVIFNSRHSASALAAKSAKTETTAAIILNKFDRISGTSDNEG